MTHTILEDTFLLYFQSGYIINTSAYSAPSFPTTAVQMAYTIHWRRGTISL